ncbi:PucR family transcriptional regulator [Nocardia alba]|nr:helix-turn-helix domain-containing protein [Nocardia alba]
MMAIDEILCAPARSEDSATDAALNKFAMSLLSGSCINLSIARHFQIPTTNTFVVVAAGFCQQPDAALTDRATTIPEARLDDIRRCLAAECGFPIPALLGPGYGTILIPASSDLGRRIGDLPALLSAAARKATTTVAIESATASISEAAETAHELLDLAIRLRKEPQLYRLGELAVEYQVTRPGPGRDHLMSLLKPLEEHAELLQTLEVLVRQGFDRKRSARRLCIHPNTVDYRMRRILALTGLPGTHASHWRLFTALTAWTFVRAEHAHHDGPYIR